MNFTDNILAQLSYLRRTQKNVADKLKRMPDGRIKCRKKNGKAYYTIYDSNSQKETGLSKDPSKRNLYLFKQDLERQLHAIEANIDFLEKINTHYIPINTSVLQWDGVAAQMNSCHPEDRKHLYHGVYYRSKSEAAIAAMLTSYDIPFKYEVRLNLQNRTFYPDFYIKRPRDGKIFIWEAHSSLPSVTLHLTPLPVLKVQNPGVRQLQIQSRRILCMDRNEHLRPYSFRRQPQSLCGGVA